MRRVYHTSGIEPASDFDASTVVSAGCDKCQNSCAAPALHSGGTSGQSLSLDDAAGHCQRAFDLESETDLIAHAWPHLPQHVRESILLLVQAGLSE
jgi:hypothetical protein